MNEFVTSYNTLDLPPRDDAPQADFGAIAHWVNQTKLWRSAWDIERERVARLSRELDAFRQKKGSEEP